MNITPTSVAAVLLAVTLAVPLPALAATAEPGEPADAVTETATDTTAPTRDRAPDTDSCPHSLLPPEPRTTSEVPAPGQASPAPLPVIVGDGCGVSIPPGFQVPEDLLASAWLVADLDSGEVIAAKDPHGRYRPASIIKVLLAVVALRDLDPSTVVEISDESAGQHGSAAGIGAGGRYTVEQLLQGLLLASGNDTAHALAQELGGDEAARRKVNELATELGTTDTFAASYSGLDGPGMSTSAFDMGLVYRHAFADPAFARIVGTESVDFPGYGELEGYELWNDNGLFLNDPDGIGGKTGYTDDANHTFVGALDRDGRRLLAVVLDTTVDKARPWEQAQQLLHAAYELPTGMGVDALEPVAVEAEITPGPIPDSPENEEATLGDSSGSPGWLVPGVIAVVVVGAALAAIAVISGRPRRRPTGHGPRHSR